MTENIGERRPVIALGIDFSQMPELTPEDATRIIERASCDKVLDLRWEDPRESMRRARRLAREAGIGPIVDI